MKYNDLINELFDLLDQDPDIQKIKHLKKVLLNNQDFLSDLEDYQLKKTVNSKKKLYEHQDFIVYMKSSNKIRIFLEELKQKFRFYEVKECLK